MLKNKNINIILILSLILFSIRWILSLYIFDENLSVKIIHESVLDGYAYFPLVKYLTFFEFNNSFDPYIDNLKVIPLPLAGIIFHSILFKVFGYFGFIIAEFIAIFIFLLIFYKIFSSFFSENESLVLSLFLFIIPSIISIINIESLPHINLLKNNFYSLRVPRPMVSSLYLFTFIYLIILMDKNIIFKKNYFISLGIILGLSLSSFYHFFVIEALAMLIFLFYKFKINLFKKIFENYKYFLLSFFIFLLVTSPFLINIYFHETEFTERIGVIFLDYEKKKILLQHYFQGYASVKFLFIFALTCAMTYFVNIKKIKKFQLLNIFFILFLSCTISPVLFILFANKTTVLYHFNNAIFVWFFLFIIIFIFIILKEYSNIKLSQIKSRIFFIFMILIYSSNIYLNNQYNDNEKKNKRVEFQKVTTLINQNVTISNSSLLTFNDKLIVWSILNDIKYLNLVNGIYTPKQNSMIENDLIKNFKFLGLNVNDFENFLENKKAGWRYWNKNVGMFFYMKYQANSLKTYNNSKNFDQKIYNHIASSSPLYFQQIAIPDEEYIRLISKFKKVELENFINPDIIVLENSMPLTKKVFLNEKY